MTTEETANSLEHHCSDGSCCSHEASHAHNQHEGAHSCPVCGPAHNVTDGVGHDRGLGRLRLAILGGFLILNSYILEALLPDQLFAAQISVLVGAIILSVPIIITAIKDLMIGQVYMNELVALALLAAFAGGEFRTVGIIAFFLLLGIIIESRTASGAQRSIEGLIKLTPNTAHKIGDDGSEVDVDVLTLSVGDKVRVRPGENFPTDGVILSGETTVNQASITGESLPLDKTVKSEVYAGTQNLTGVVEVEVTRVGEDTTLGKVKEMILNAEGSKTPIVRIIDKYAGYYTPTILMLAAVTWIVSGGDINRVITLMVIACPCAVVLSTPTAVIAAVASAARMGVLIKDVTHLELASQINGFAFDKTGTLTEGVLSVGHLHPVNDTTPAELLDVAASTEAHSNHPTAKALQILAKEAGLVLKKVTQFKEEHGRGVSGNMDGASCLIGRETWLKEQGIDLSAYDAEIQNKEGMSLVHVAKNGVYMGWIGFKDKIREQAAVAIQELKELGVKECAMFTGDNNSVAKQVAETLGIQTYKGECLPETKVQYVNGMKKDLIVAVVGDGVNDAPALTAGDLGIAMGAIGSDIAINSASIALMNNDLRRLPFLIYLSRRTRTIIHLNLLFSLLLVIGGIILSVFGLMSPVMAAIIHISSTLLIIFNSARLIRSGEHLTEEHSDLNL